MTSSGFTESVPMARRWPRALPPLALRAISIACPIVILAFLANSLTWRDWATLTSGPRCPVRADGTQVVIEAATLDLQPGQVLSPELIKQIDPGLRSILGQLRWHWLAGFGGCMLAIALLVVLRWRLLMPHRATHRHHAFWPCAVVWGRSQVISLLPLSQVGGDLYRIERSRHPVGGLAPATAVIVLEKLLGFSAIIAVALAGLYASGLLSGKPLPILALSILILSVLVLVARIVPTSASQRWTQQTESMDLSTRQTKVARAWQAIQPVIPRPGKLLAAVGLSGGVQVIAPLSYWFVDRALGLETPLWCYLVAIPAITLAQYFPIHIAGIGVFEGGLWLFLHSWAGRTANEVMAISATARILSLAWLAGLSLSFIARVSMAPQSPPIAAMPESAHPCGANEFSTEGQAVSA